MKWRSPTVVSMAPTTFRTYTLRPLGQDAVTIALPAPHFRRVIIAQRIPLTGVFITRSAAELTIPGQAQPGDAYQLPIAPVLVPGPSRVFVLAPGDALYAGGGTSVGGGLASVSVSISQEIPVSLGLAHFPGAKTAFRTFRLPLNGTDPAITIVPVAKVPRRVAVRAVGFPFGAFLSASPGELNLGQPVPGGGYDVSAAGIFVIAPGQGLYGMRTFAGSINIATAISDIHLSRGSMKGNP